MTEVFGIVSTKKGTSFDVTNVLITQSLWITDSPNDCIIYRSVLWVRIRRQRIRRAVKKFPEMWYNSVMVGHMTTLT